MNKDKHPYIVIKCAVMVILIGRLEDVDVHYKPLVLLTYYCRYFNIFNDLDFQVSLGALQPSVEA